MKFDKEMYSLVKDKIEVKKLHEEIQKKIFLMLPEKWDRLYLYASVIERENQSIAGEMFFYYFPKGILSKRPINVYEVPRRFSIDENQYFKFADDLYEEIKKLRLLLIENKTKPWSEISIIIEKLKYKAIYGYEDLLSSELDEEARRIIWTYKYLKLPYQSLNKREKEIIDKYEKINKHEEITFEMSLYNKELNKNMETRKDIEKKLKFVTEDKIEEMEFRKTHVPKSQILITK